MKPSDYVQVRAAVLERRGRGEYDDADCPNKCRETHAQEQRAALLRIAEGYFEVVDCKPQRFCCGYCYVALPGLRDLGLRMPDGSTHRVQQEWFEVVPRERVSCES